MNARPGALWAGWIGLTTYEIGTGAPVEHHFCCADHAMLWLAQNERTEVIG